MKHALSVDEVPRPQAIFTLHVDEKVLSARALDRYGAHAVRPIPRQQHRQQHAAEPAVAVIENDQVVHVDIALGKPIVPQALELVHRCQVDDEVSEWSNRRHVRRSEPAARLHIDIHLPTVATLVLIDPGQAYDAKALQMGLVL
jgi:hypothetical protein